jgi:GT2 family glycosyltransferase
MAKNEYFMWAAHDDVWHPNFLNELIAQFNENHDVGLVHGWLNIVDPVSGVLKKTVRPMPSFSDSKATNFLAEHLSPCGGKIYGLFKTDLIAKFLAEDLLIEDYFDALLVDYVNLNSYTIIVPKILFYYGEEFNKNRDSLSTGKFKIFKFDHFTYVKSCIKLIFRNTNFRLHSKFAVSFSYLFLFSIFKLRGIKRKPK